jgi:intein/homing endonuclease
MAMKYLRNKITAHNTEKLEKNVFGRKFVRKIMFEKFSAEKEFRKIGSWKVEASWSSSQAEMAKHPGPFSPLKK